ncbi:MAG: hypothetical protein IKV31_01090 [Paludibacteraceae bacterium]|nr:hypothetical protein [Paludibacteraceae bacterium]
MKIKLLALYLGLLMLACTPVNQPENTGNDKPNNPTNEIDPQLLLGYWYEKEYPSVVIEINDSLIVQHYNIVLESRYVINGGKLEIERLYFPETDSCCRYATCEYSLVDDTLYIKNFKHALIQPFHPTFIDGKLIKL